MDLVVSRGYRCAPVLLCPRAVGGLRLVCLGLCCHWPVSGGPLLRAEGLGSGSRLLGSKSGRMAPGGAARVGDSGRVGPTANPASGFGACPLILLIFLL